MNKLKYLFFKKFGTLTETEFKPSVRNKKFCAYLGSEQQKAGVCLTLITGEWELQQAPGQ